MTTPILDGYRQVQSSGEPFGNRRSRRYKRCGNVAAYRSWHAAWPPAGGVVTQTAWDGWRPIEDYRGGQLVSRRIYGLGLDEVVRMETDLDGDGTLDQSLIPLFDSTGNLALVADEQGKPIERYRYTAYGEQKIYADLTPPAIEQVRVRGGEIWLELSEEALASELQKAFGSGQLSLVETSTSEPLAVSLEQPVQAGRQARRRIVITPSEPPTEGTEVRLTLEPQALVDLFHNRPAAPFELTFAWPTGDLLLQDVAAPSVELVRLRSGVLEIELSEEADLASAAAAILIDGTTTTWSLAAEGYTLVGESAITLGSHTLAIGGGPLDLDGKGLLAPLTLGVVRQSIVPDEIVYVAPDPTEIAESAIGNRFAFHGLAEDAETGFVYMRNRYFDPQLGGFVTADPLGYIDGPATYVFSKNSPENFKDPFGLQEQPSIIKVRRHRSPIYVKVDPIRSSRAWSTSDIENQLNVANEILGKKADVYVYWTQIKDDPDPKEDLDTKSIDRALDAAAKLFSTDASGHSGIPLIYIRSNSDETREGGATVTREHNIHFRASIIFRYWNGRLTTRLTTAHELGHALGDLCDPMGLDKGCTFDAPQPSYGGLMMYPSEQYPRAQGEELSDEEVMRLRNKAKVLATFSERTHR